MHNNKKTESREQILLQQTEALAKTGSWELNLRTNELYWSDGVFLILGYEPQSFEVNYQLGIEVIHPDDRDRAIQEMEYAKQSGNDYNIYKRFVAADGSIKHIQSKGKVLKDEEGQPVKLIGVFQDITEEVAAERITSASEKRFKALVQEGSDLIAILDLKANYKYVSPTSTTILGIPPEEFIGKNAFDYIHPEDKGEVYANFFRLKDEKRISINPFRFKDKNGSWRWIETIVTNMMDEPAVGGIIANGRDVTNKVYSEQKIRHSERRFKALVQEGADLISVINIDGTYNYVSPNYEQYLGLSEEALLGKNALDFVHPEDVGHIKEALERVKTENRVKSYPFRYKHRYYGWRWLRSIGTNLLDDESIQGIVINSVDITELMEAQEKLKASEARYRGFYESQTNYVIRTDMEGNYTYVNKKFMQDFGWIYPEEDIIGQSCLPSICEYDHAKVFEVVKKCNAAPETVFKVEIDKPARDGGIVSTLWDFVCVVDAEGNPSEMQCMGIDITERIQFEKALKESNERYEYVNKATNDAIYDWDVEQDVFYWGAGFNRIFGHDSGNGEFKLKDWEKLVHPSDIKETQKRLNRFLADKTNNMWQCEYRFQRADGSYAWAEEKGHLIRNNKGEAQRMIGVLRDVTEAKKVEIQKELQQQVAQYFKKERDLHKILGNVLPYLTEFGDFKTGEFWLKSHNEKYLNLISTYAIDKTSGVFYKASMDIGSIKEGEGFPGLVWQNQKMEVWENVGNHNSFFRKEAAKKAGINSVIGFPIFNKDQFVGVLIFGSNELVKEINPRIKSFESLQYFIGAEIKRKQQEEEMYLLFQSAPDILAIASPSGYFAKVNPAFCEILGYSEEELTSQPFENFIHPDDLNATRKEYKETITGQRQANKSINRYRTKSGNYRTISWTSSQVFGEDGLVFAFGRDVTEIKKLQKLLDNATQLARIGGWEIDVVNNILYWSSMTKEIHEVSQDYEPKLELAINFYREDFREKVKKAIAEAMEKGAPFDFEMPIITAKGNERWIRAIGNPVMGEERCVRLYGSFQDIHREKTAEIELQKAFEEKNQYLLRLKETEQRYSDLFHFSPQPLWVYDINTLQFLDVNEAAKSQYGYTYEEFLQMDILGIRPESEIPLIKEKAAQLRQQEETFLHEEFRHKKKNGEEIIVDARSNIINYDGKKAVVVMATDITERYQHMQAIEEQNKRLREIAWTQSHVVRGPVARIMGLIQVISHDTVTLGEKEEMLQEVMNSAEELDSIIKNIVKNSHHTDIYGS